MPIWQQYRDQFPSTENLLWLNHAAVSPLCRPAAVAMRTLVGDAHEWASFHYQKWMQVYDSLRVEAAKLIGAKSAEIAIVKNTSEGIATVQMGLDWKAGDQVVAFKEEFPSNYYPWKLLENRGVRVKWLSIYDSLQTIDEACRGARLLAISYVNYLSGHRVDLKAIGEICRRRGAFFLVDAIQGLGVFPIDVEGFGIDALAADGHKWLMSTEGCGILYIRKSRQDQIAPVEFGWTNVAGFHDYASRDMALRPDAGRYECGTLNTVGIYGLNAAIRFVNEVGIDRIGEQVLALAEQISQNIHSRGYELIREWERETGSGIVTLRKKDVDSRLVVSKLKEQRIQAAARQGWVRISPHFYQSPEEMDRVIQALP